MGVTQFNLGSGGSLYNIRAPFSVRLLVGRKQHNYFPSRGVLLLLLPLASSAIYGDSREGKTSAVNVRERGGERQRELVARQKQRVIFPVQYSIRPPHISVELRSRAVSYRYALT